MTSLVTISLSFFPSPNDGACSAEDRTDGAVEIADAGFAAFVMAMMKLTDSGEIDMLLRDSVSSI